MATPVHLEKHGGRSQPTWGHLSLRHRLGGEVTDSMPAAVDATGQLDTTEEGCRSVLIWSKAEETRQRPQLTPISADAVCSWWRGSVSCHGASNPGSRIGRGTSPAGLSRSTDFSAGFLSQLQSPNVQLHDARGSPSRHRREFNFGTNSAGLQSCACLKVSYPRSISQDGHDSCRLEPWVDPEVENPQPISDQKRFLRSGPCPPYSLFSLRLHVSSGYGG